MLLRDREIMNKIPGELPKLSRFLSGIASVDPEQDTRVSGLSGNSRTILPGEAFIAVGAATGFIDEAIKLGCAAVLIEPQTIAPNTYSIPVIEIPELRSKLGLIASKFYDHPSQWLKMIGITGTNGKTSCSQFIAQLLQLERMQTAVIGTLGYGKLEHLQDFGLTTPDAITLQKMLAEFRNTGIQVVSMEVSSHALDQGRVQETLFDIGVFTNLSHEHLDYHGDMEHYAQAKRQLFTFPCLRHAVINLDDEFGRKLAHEFGSKFPTIGYTLEDQQVDHVQVVSAHHIQYVSGGITAKIRTPWGDGDLTCPFYGTFNLSNALVAVACACLLGLPLDEVLMRVSDLKVVAGRMQTVGGKDEPLFVVDYAHKPQALEKVLATLRSHATGRLICVFGCGGDRDRGKRPLMAKISGDLADLTIITHDNPRTENPQTILQEIQSGFSAQHNYLVEPDRAQAIALAFQEAKAGDVVLIAGKGHEDYQLIGDQKHHFSDMEQVKLLLEKGKQ